MQLADTSGEANGYKLYTVDCRVTIDRWHMQLADTGDMACYEQIVLTICKYRSLIGFR
jgi:hypothetical protein